MREFTAKDSMRYPISALFPALFGILGRTRPGAFVLIAAILSACAQTPPTSAERYADWLSDDPRRIGVAADAVLPEPAFREMESQAGEGALDGLKTGAAVGALPGAALASTPDPSGFALVLGVAAMIVGAPIGAVVGAATGAATAEPIVVATGPVNKLDGAEALLQEALSDWPVASDFRDLVLARATGAGRHDLQALDAAPLGMPPGPHKDVAEEAGPDATVELQLTHIGFTGDALEPEDDDPPEVAPSLTARAVIRYGNDWAGASHATEAVRWEGRERALDDWVAEGPDGLRASLREGLGSLAREIAGQILP
jgi:hypothetical protein